MPKFRKKPVEIEAQQFDGTYASAATIEKWSGGAAVHDQIRGVAHLFIETLEGRMEAARGDFVIRGVQGEFYPCKPDIFAATYEPVGG